MFTLDETVQHQQTTVRYLQSRDQVHFTVNDCKHNQLDKILIIPCCCLSSISSNRWLYWFPLASTKCYVLSYYSSRTLICYLRCVTILFYIWQFEHTSENKVYYFLFILKIAICIKMLLHSFTFVKSLIFFIPQCFLISL